MQTAHMISEEATLMTDHAVPGSEPAGPMGRIVPLLKTAALVVTILGAIPTAVTVYHAWQYKVPIWEVSHRLAQYEIIKRNIGCKIEYKALTTGQGTILDAGACPATGDISLRISTADGKEAYEWVAYNDLEMPGEQAPASLLDLLVGTARAATAAPAPRLAQNFEVICQTLLSPKELIRVVKDRGKCYRETMSPVRGSVDKREEVPCDTKCPGAG